MMMMTMMMHAIAGVPRLRRRHHIIDDEEEQGDTGGGEEQRGDVDPTGQGDGDVGDLLGEAMALGFLGAGNLMEVDGTE